MKDYTYRLIELKDEMGKSLDNIDTLIAQTDALCEAIRGSKHADLLKDLLSASEENLGHYAKQKEEIKRRMTLLDDAIHLAKGDGALTQFMGIIFEALGIFASTESADEQA